MINSAKAILKFKKLTDKARLPTKGSPAAAGYDLYSAADMVVPSRGKMLVPTNLSVAVPEGNYGRVAPRSGLAWKNFIDVGAGVVDVDYRGECKYSSCNI
jgi:dUTP pyrophosphatase